MSRALLCILLFVLSPFAIAQKLDDGTLRYCVERARTALSVAESLAEGLSVERINLAFFRAPRDESELADREQWIADLKAEVAKNYAALPPGPDRPKLAAQKVAEACAYEHGKKRRMKQVASSESIRNETDRRDACREALVDHIYIGQSVGRGMPRDQLESRAKYNASRLGEERVAKIMVLIEEAYTSGDIQAWFDRYLAACMGRGT